MGFLRRLLGGGEADGERSDSPAPAGQAAPPPAVGRADPDAEERAHELELARFEQGRIDDLVRRQQRFADRSWTPPRQGGERRAGDEEAVRE